MHERTEEVLHRPPRHFGVDASRWTLPRLLSRFGWLPVETESGLSRLLRRLGFAWKRARTYVHSPDPHYDGKCDYIDRCRAEVDADPHNCVLLYQDEVTYYNAASRAHAWHRRGQSTQPLARLSRQGERIQRITATLDVRTGKVVYDQAKKAGVEETIALYRQLADIYADKRTIYIVQDNCPIHFHPRVLGQLEAQQWPYSHSVPPSWPAFDPDERVDDPLPIQLVGLPTYASWLNPIEKLWRWLKADVLHLHRHADEWERLKRRVEAFLARFQDGSDALLRYCGIA